KGTASPFNSKTLRASAGSLFRVPVLHGVEASLARAALQQHETTLYAAVPGAERPVRSIHETDLTGNCALIIGNEARGVSPDLRSAAVDLTIPTAGVESLNAAMAASIILYEARRQ